MNVETRNLAVSFDSPGRMLNTLRSALEQTVDAPRTRTERLPAPLRNEQHVVIIDSFSRRAEYIARLISAAGYRPFVAGSALDAYTAFLQDTIIPIAIILSPEDTADSLFLLRLQQRTLHKYHREVLFIRLHAEVAHRTSASLPLATPLALPEPSSTQAARHIQPKRIVRPEARSSPEPVLQAFASPPADTARVETSGRAQAAASPTPPSGSTETHSRLRRVRTEPLHPVRTMPLPPPSANTPFPATSRPATAPVPAMKPGPLSMPGMPAPQAPPAGVAQESIVEIKEVEKKSLEGQNLGRYQIQNPLGGSPLGDVYMVYDRLRETSIAFKSIQGNVLPNGFLEDVYVNTNLFQQEVDTLASLKHPHILPVLSAGKSYISGTPFYYKTMPYCKDGSLASWLYEHAAAGQCSLRDALPVAMQLADALQFAHSHNVLYQNFKLTNVLLQGEAGSNISRLRVLLADFALTGDNKHVLRSPYTLRYLAPEQWNGVALPASDQYGLAALLYELLTGRPPFQSHQEHLLRHMHMTMQPRPPGTFNPGLSFGTSAALLRALSKNPRERFSSIAEFERALRSSI